MRSTGKKIQQEYGSAITKAKQEHWMAFLEGLSYAGVWTANRYISGDTSDGGKTHIPRLTLHLNDPLVASTVSTTNKEKSTMLMKLMFPIAS